jgi:hypothetical protein
LDTRDKILDQKQAANIAAGFRSRGVKWKLVEGYFDVLTPALVRSLETLADGTPLMAAVLDPAAPLLPSRARAELAASLRVVDYVLLLGGAALEPLLEELRPDEIIRAEPEDRRRFEALIEYVHRRNSA